MTRRLPSIVWTLLLAVISVTVVYLLTRNGWLDFHAIGRAFRDRTGMLIASIACVVTISILGIVKHLWALHVVKVQAPWAQVAAANLLGQAVGVWSPGSMAVTEGLRIGIIARSLKSTSDSGATARMAMASLLDRVISSGAIIWIGAVGVTLHLITQHVSLAQAGALPLLVAAYVMGGGLLVAGPIVATTGPFRWTARGLDKIGGVAASPLRRIAVVLHHMEDAARHWRAKTSATAPVVFLAGTNATLNALTLWFASIAIDQPVPLWLIVSLLPITIVGSALPIGVAGLGGPQLLMMAVFAPFGIDLRTVATMSLLQLSLTALVQTALGVGWASFRHGDVRLALNGRKHPEG